MAIARRGLIHAARCWAACDLALAAYCWAFTPAPRLPSQAPPNKLEVRASFMPPAVRAAYDLAPAARRWACNPAPAARCWAACFLALACYQMYMLKCIIPTSPQRSSTFNVQ